MAGKKSNKDLSKFFSFELNSQQKEAFELLKDFTKSKHQQVFVLKGYAGTGKTSLMSGLIVWLQEQKINYELLASTGRASKILNNKTGSKSQTIHSHIFRFSELSEDLDLMSINQETPEVEDSGQINLFFSLKTIKSEKTKVYIIDEASMISDVLVPSTNFAQFGSGNLLNDILRFDKNGKYIFVGDPCQLPPVGQDFSPALSANHIVTKYHKRAEEFELTHIIRQEGENGIVTASMKLREKFQQNLETKWAKIPLKRTNDIQLYPSKSDFLNRYISLLESQGLKYTTLIAQTNRHCLELNKEIRRHFNPNPKSLEVGDLLMVTQNNYLVDLVNGDQVVVKQVGAKEYRCGLRFVSAIVEGLFNGEEYSILIQEDILNTTYTNLSAVQQKALMMDFFNRMKGENIPQKSAAFRENMLTDPYLNSLKVVYGYAITCHKSQGGEWDEVFLYQDNKIQGLPRPGIYQWWYTAVTRAKTKLHALSDWFVE